MVNHILRSVNSVHCLSGSCNSFWSWYIFWIVSVKIDLRIWSTKYQYTHANMALNHKWLGISGFMACLVSLLCLGIAIIVLPAQHLYCHQCTVCVALFDPFLIRLSMVMLHQSQKSLRLRWSVYDLTWPIRSIAYHSLSVLIAESDGTSRKGLKGSCTRAASYQCFLLGCLSRHLYKNLVLAWLVGI